MIFIGDVHGKYDRYKTLMKQHKDTIQVGDMGVGFKKYFPYPHNDGQLSEGSTVYLANPPYDVMVEGNHRFIRGNHDNPEVCRNHTQWIPDGHVEGDMMFIGGAVSIDKAWRQEGFDWWADEELSYAELDELVVKVADLKPRIMITHTIPDRIAEICIRENRIPYVDDIPCRTQQAMDRMFELHKPELWIFGHWHVNWEHVKDGTRFVCVNELETFEI